MLFTVKTKRIYSRPIWVAALICYGIITTTGQAATNTVSRIAVLAHRGDAEALTQWSATANYLTAQIPGYTFEIVPVNNHNVDDIIKNSQLDFVLTNPGQYANLEANYGITRIATLKNKRQNGAYTVFGAVIFTKSNREDIMSLADLKGKTFMAVHPEAFGGWWMAWHELKHVGINPEQDLKSLSFAGLPQDRVVEAVQAGEVDAGTVRTDTLERMAKENKITLSDFRILDPKQTANFPFAHSTHLYPEWAFAVTTQTSKDLAQQVAMALLSLPPDSEAATTGQYVGWTVPLDYQPVHQLMKELRVGAYENYGQVTIRGLIQQYGYWLLAGLFFIALLTVITAYVVLINYRIKSAKAMLEKENLQRRSAEEALRKNHDELLVTHQRLEEVHQQLLQSEKMASIGQLAAGVAHEINNPIGYINSNLGTLNTYIGELITLLDAYGTFEEQLTSDSEAVKKLHELKASLDIDYLKTDLIALLDETMEGTSRVRQIVQDLKDFSHVDGGDWSQVDLHKGLESTLNIAHSELKPKATIIKEYGALPMVECLPSQINQVFMNLLINAAQAIEQQGVITIRTGTAGEDVWIEIMDNGKGITSANISKIFDPFFTTKPIGQGTGLGLSVSYGIVKRHGGHLSVKSSLGEGTTFRLTLPKERPPRHQPAA